MNNLFGKNSMYRLSIILFISIVCSPFLGQISFTSEQIKHSQP